MRFFLIVLFYGFTLHINAENPLNAATSICANEVSAFTNNSGNIKEELPFWKQPVDVQNHTNSKAPASPELKEKAKGYMANKKQMGFQENKGQMTDVNGAPVPFVLFKAEAPNLTIWVTTTGITYQFFKVDENEENEKNEGNKKQQHGPMKEEKIEGEWHRVDMILKGASIKQENVITENDITQGDVNYYLGHCPNGIFRVKTYGKITIKDVYPGIDWVLYASSSPLSSGEGKGVRPGLKHDFIVHPKANPKQIKLVYEGSGKLDVTNNQIHFKNKIGELTEGKLLCYQGEETNAVASNYNVQKNVLPLYTAAGNVRLEESNPSNTQKRNSVFSYEIGIETEEYDTNQLLVIDPQLIWSTFYGGILSDGFMSADTDANGNLYITGYTLSNNFPLQILVGAYNQPSFIGAGVLISDAVVLRFTSLGILTWATYYAGNDDEWGNDISLDAGNNVYVTGFTKSTNFPLQNLAGAYNQNTFGGGTGYFGDIFILRFNTSGVRIWATYYGGNDDENATCIAFDSNNNLFICGYTSSTNFPLQSLTGAFNQSFGTAFILRFNTSGACTWATLYGGSTGAEAYSMAIDASNNLYLVGIAYSSFPLQNLAGAYNQAHSAGIIDAFISKFTSSGICIWATCYGGSNGADYAYSVAVDASNNVYVVGETESNNFPIQSMFGAYNQLVFGGGPKDAFIVRFNNIGVCIWSTFYGGTSGEAFMTFNGLSVDLCDNVYMSFDTTSPNLFTLGNSNCEYYNSTINSNSGAFGIYDNFIIKFSPSGAVKWANYFGGDGIDFRTTVVCDSNGNLFVTGEWSAVNSILSYPLTNPGGGAYYSPIYNSNGGSAPNHDSYIAKFIPNTPTYNQNQTNPNNCTCNGIATISITCSEAPYSYVWSNGYSVSNTTLATNSNTNLCPGVYQVTVTSGCNYSYTTTYTLTGAAASLTANLSTINASCASLTGSVTINNVINGVPSYTLAEGTTTLASNVSTPYTIGSVSIGTHIYVLTSFNGCSATFTTIITSNTITPNLNVITPVMLNCNPSYTVLTASSSSTGTPNYLWSGPGLISGANTPSPTVSLSGNYVVSISIGLCTNTAIVSVINNTNVPSVNITQIGILSCTQPVTLTANSNVANANYSWSPQTITTNTIVISTAGIYSLVVTNPVNGCSTNSTVSVNNPNLFAVTVNATPITCFGANNGKLQVMVIGGIGPFTINNLNSSNTFTPVIVFPYTIANLSAANYSVLIKDNSSGCSQIITKIISEPTLLQVTALNNFTNCAGETTTINPQVSGGILPYSYQWLPNGAISPNLLLTTSASSLTTINTISLTVSDNRGCKVFSILQNTVYPNPEVQFLPKSLKGCTPVCASFSLVNQQNANYTYNWLFSYNAAVSSPTLSNLYQPKQCFTQAGTYNVGLTVTNSFGCIATQIYRDLLEVYPKPIADFDFSPNPGNVLEPLIHFTNTSSNANYYYWNFGEANNNNNSSALTNPNFIYSNAGTYLVTLIASSAKGCADTAYKYVKIEEDFAVYIPNTFSPNEDNLNDAWGPQGIGISDKDYELIVFNRWGEKLFTSKTFENRWNGTYKGELVKNDVYVYKLKCKSIINSKPKEFNGHVLVNK